MPAGPWENNENKIKIIEVNPIRNQKC